MDLDAILGELDALGSSLQQQQSTVETQLTKHRAAPNGTERDVAAECTFESVDAQLFAAVTDISALEKVRDFTVEQPVNYRAVDRTAGGVRESHFRNSSGSGSGNTMSSLSSGDSAIGDGHSKKVISLSCLWLELIFINIIL